MLMNCSKQTIQKTQKETFCVLPHPMFYSAFSDQTFSVVWSSTSSFTPLCWPISSSRADAGDLQEATGADTGGNASLHVTAGCWSPDGLCSSSYSSLRSTLWVLHAPLSSVQVPSVSLWSRNGSVGEVWTKLSGQNLGQQVPTTAPLCCPEALTLQLFLRNLQSFPFRKRRKKKTQSPLSVNVFSVKLIRLFLGP